ncbi:hypothetical protein DL89DRAFT_256746 [Linderina pennispora]|uniref:Uncharacterized protein n=1 Tax=Linderina pennispora TaxID=61395 RepID=A0A1Y1WAI3_9FUNG|nr:uncharacterized protein DL89DRAFT_256746 [Linderina pennispora]ORX70533.1 hypothetical protein DL89DRAFT_256746 [Linderina pennispora]
MDSSDSDSDGFFSDIRQLRRQFGLSSAQTPKLPPTAGACAAQKLAAEHKGLSQRAPTEQQAPVEPEQTPASHSRTGPTSTTPLLSPSQRKQPKTTTPSRIPPRTPQSRVASPYTPRRSTQVTPARKPLAGVPTPTIENSSKRTDKGKGTPVTPTAFQLFGGRLEDGTPKSFQTMQSLWGRDDTADPLLARSAAPQKTPAGSSRTAVHSPWPTPTAGRGGLHTLEFGSPVPRRPQDSSPGGLLGSVEEALVTDADIDLAKRKLGEEQAITQQQILREIRERLLGFSNSSPDALGSSVTVVPGSVTLLCQFYTLGHGRLAYSDEGILWAGSTLGKIATVAQSNGGGIASNSEKAVLLFPWQRVTGLRRKTVDGQELVLMTVDDDLGIAFQGSEGWESRPAEELVKQMNKALEKTQAQQRSSSKQALVGPEHRVSGGMDAEAQIIGDLLALSQQISGPELGEQNISMALR